MYLYWPAVLIAASAFVVLNPLPLLYHRSRFWFLYSNVSGPHESCRCVILTMRSGGCFLLVYTLSSSAISSLEICFARLHMLWV